MTHEAQDGEICQGNRRADLKILGDKRKLGVKPTSVTQSVINLISLRLSPDAYLIKKNSDCNGKDILIPGNGNRYKDRQDVSMKVVNIAPITLQFALTYYFCIR